MPDAGAALRSRYFHVPRLGDAFQPTFATGS
jgi:hypothetical protein